MGYKVILDKTNRYTGIKELIPGCVYLDDKGTKLLFVGFGRFSYPGRVEPSSFIYFKVDEIEKLIDDGVLSRDLKEWTDRLANMYLYVSEKPRLLKSFVYEAVPSDYFENFVAYEYFGPWRSCSTTKVRIRPIVVPGVCEVRKI